MKENINNPNKGLHTDNSFVEQPKDTTRFVLNAVSETEEGDQTFLSNEESNEICHNLTEGYILLGQVYIGNGDTVLLSVSPDETLSEIGIADRDCNYVVHVNADLGFKISKQIGATYRLRRGCERVIYFTTPKPMFYNFEKEENFKDRNGNFEASKFSLFRKYNSIPIFKKIEVQEGGSLLAGSYNIAIQYLDQNFNPTEWITTTETICIYHNVISTSFHYIEGSTNQVSNYQDFKGSTNKSIVINLAALDTNFLFYRLAFIEATTGFGNINSVKYSSPISTQIKNFSYSGNNFETVGSIEEVQQFENIIEEAEHIEQIENRLLLGNTKGDNTKYCRLQKYASKITADVSRKTILLDENIIDNPKRPTIHNESVGYMPGEIYSFGIVYIFEDNTSSPVYHIPGKAIGFTSNMSDNNKLVNTYYSDNNTCEEIDYWGLDSEDEVLKNTPVRHHRFPEREYGLGDDVLIKETGTYSYHTLIIEITGIISPSYNNELIYITIEYEDEGSPYQITTTIDLNSYIDTYTETFYIGVYGVPTSILIYENGINIINDTTSLDTDLFFHVETTTSSTKTLGLDDYKYTILYGITFSNIIKPTIEEIGKEVKGYFIVRNESTEDNRTILDSGVLFPVLKDPLTDYMSVGLPLFTEGTAGDIVKRDMYGFIHPEFLFNRREYKSLSSMKLQFQSIYNNIAIRNTSFLVQDVAAGTSYDPSIHKGADGDGFSLHILSHPTHTTFTDFGFSYPVLEEEWDNTEIKEIAYLNSLDSITLNDSTNAYCSVYNLSADNRMGVVSLNSIKTIPPEFIPYVKLKRNLSDPYSNFRNLPYYKEHKNYQLFIQDIEESTIFNGDTFVSPMRFNSTVFNDIKVADRAEKKGLGQKILGVLSVVAGVVLIVASVVTGGTTAAAGVLLIGFGISQFATGLKISQMAKVYQELYDQGLKNTIFDQISENAFDTANDDDEIQWRGTYVNIFFESRVNIGLRKSATIGITSFLDTHLEEDNSSLLPIPNLYRQNNVADVADGTGGAGNFHEIYLLNKLTVVDSDNDSGRLYKGIPNAELYEINADYIRRNKEKIYFHLGLEYDCCSDCVEEFPHRVHYSEQSFQEELIDNYQIFLPNNYIDIEGETGKITNLFRIQNNLYIHTEEALWHLPQNIQERITGDVVSFIGTGSFFNIPPRKIIDDSKSSAGTNYKNSTIKTKYGVFFVSDTDRKIYQFDGNQLKPISDIGNSNWFKENIPLTIKEDFYSSNKNNYEYLGNNSNKIGAGYISVYDSKKERVIFTKLDFKLVEALLSNNDYNITFYNNTIYLFTGYQAIIDYQKTEGYNFIGIVFGQMKFYKDSTSSFINVPGSPLNTEDFIDYDKSWTISYSLKNESWTSWHSYTPNFYFHTQDKFYSWLINNDNIWRHNKKGEYQTYYGDFAPHIIEFVATSSPLKNKIWDEVELHTTAKEFIENENEYLNKRFITFNKAIFYNSRQLSGLLNLVVKDEQNSTKGYLREQIVNELDNILIDNNEGIWTLNNFRDIVVDYDAPMFNKNKATLSTTYYTDKEINENIIDVNKSWTDLESFRDKYLVVRLIFDNFDNVRLITNYSNETEKDSTR